MTTGPRIEPIPEISVGEAHDRVANGAAHLVDVREQHEWDAGHAPHAIHVPLGELPARAGALPDGPLLLVCHVGGRSMRAADWLHGQGRDTANVGGGMDAWEKAGLPVIR
jgi:rhodanese-related sulfurtransferase